MAPEIARPGAQEQRLAALCRLAPPLPVRRTASKIPFTSVLSLAVYLFPTGLLASRSPSAPAGERILRLWRRLSPWPGGRWLFSLVLGRMVPYSATLRARVVVLEPGHVRVELRDRRGLRNHLRSVHAVALANLGELASGLALTVAMPAGLRGIVAGFDVAFHKKARGRLTAESRCDVPAPGASAEHVVTAHIVDGEGAEVATFTARWLLGPVPRSGRP
jgi:acyl-coenzyme A thioesterase PaaI-like protein